MLPLIVIPSRLQAMRLPGKPLLQIGGKPMIVHVFEQAQRANVGRVVVACCGEEIASAIRAVGGEAVITDPALPSGTDRVYAALSQIDPQENHKIVINLQGDLPFFPGEFLMRTLLPLEYPFFHLSTLAAPIEKPEEITNPNVVKVALGGALQANKEVAPACYFSRQPIIGDQNRYYHHIGVYGFTREALKRFVSLPPSALEQAERLEQLRALEDGMRIGVSLVDQVPLSIDHPDDLAQAQEKMGN